MIQNAPLEKTDITASEVLHVHYREAEEVNFDYRVSLFWFRVFLFSFISARNKFTSTPYEVLTLPIPILDEVKKLS